MLLHIAHWPRQRLPWIALAASATVLVLIALYFQYIMALQPCVQCIYQRTATIALALTAWVVAIAPHRWWLRALGFAGWLGSSWVGLYTANFHVWLQSASNPLFTTCSPYPDFPGWLPLHEWLPGLFAAGGLCTETSWQLLSLSMSEWMRIIFAVYLTLGVVVLALHLIKGRRPF